MRLLHVVGARPNFPKLAPVFRAAAERGLEQQILHTGQHYDDAMSGAFIRDLGLPNPDFSLDVGSASHALQTARIIERTEPVLLAHRPDWLVVYGDVNSTMATSLVAAKLEIPVAHVEAGLRSYDLSMPEEINRIVTDRLASLLLAPSKDAVTTLLGEGTPATSIKFVGNVMIDTLFAMLPLAAETGYASSIGAEGNHVVVTLHRPSNVDDDARLSELVFQLNSIGQSRRIFFPMHPRTRNRLDALGLSLPAIHVLEPLPYAQMLDLVRTSGAVVTDSGGLQEETTALGIPCFTLRPNTERPVTVSEGTNHLVTDLSSLSSLVHSAGRASHPRRPDGWDGKAGERVVDALSCI